MAGRCLAIAALGILAGGCAVPDSVRVGCAAGTRPPYFVPAGSPPVLLGCARLGVSGRRVDFSAGRDRIGGGRHLCIHPAYSGRGRRGFFIPSLCKLRPRPSRFAVRDARRPRGYGCVIWGTAPPGTREVVARFDGGSARAAIIRVPARRSFGETPFVLFVVELPLGAGPATMTRRTSSSPASASRSGRCGATSRLS